MVERLKFLRRTGHVASMIALLLCAVGVIVSAQTPSQPPAPSRGEQRQNPQGQAEPGSAQTNPVNSVTNPGSGLSVTINNQSGNQITGNRPQQNTNGENTGATGDWWGRLISVIATVIMAAATFGIFVYTKKLRSIGDTQARILDDQAKSLTTQAGILNSTLATNKDIERAYVTMSHIPPGIEVSDWVNDGKGHPIRTQETTVHVKVRNFGNTPAMITRTLLHAHIRSEPLPAKPPYDEIQAKTIRLSLVREDEFKMHGLGGQAPEDLITRVKHDPSWKMYVLGYIDYIDKFKRHHRAGYARVYNPIKDTKEAFTDDQGRFDEDAFKKRNNLPFVTQPGYNYDRERERHEGNDWDEPQE